MCHWVFRGFCSLANARSAKLVILQSCSDAAAWYYCSIDQAKSIDSLHWTNRRCFLDDFSSGRCGQVSPMARMFHFLFSKCRSMIIPLPLSDLTQRNRFDVIRWCNFWTLWGFLLDFLRLNWLKFKLSADRFSDEWNACTATSTRLLRLKSKIVSAANPVKAFAEMFRSRLSSRRSWVNSVCWRNVPSSMCPIPVLEKNKNAVPNALLLDAGISPLRNACSLVPGILMYCSFSKLPSNWSGIVSNSQNRMLSLWTSLTFIVPLEQCNEELPRILWPFAHRASTQARQCPFFQLLGCSRCYIVWWMNSPRIRRWALGAAPIAKWGTWSNSTEAFCVDACRPKKAAYFTNLMHRKKRPVSKGKWADQGLGLILTFQLFLLGVGRTSTVYRSQSTIATFIHSHFRTK